MTMVPFYKNLRDTLEEVGITRRQLTYWKKEELIWFDLDDGKRFTRFDLYRLHALKRLIVDYKLSIDTVKRLMGDTPRVNWMNGRFIDLEEGRLLEDTDLPIAFLDQVALQPTGIDEHLLLSLVFLQLRSYRKHIPAVYQALRDELFQQLRQMDYMARIRHDVFPQPEPDDNAMTGEVPAERHIYSLSPSLPDDPTFNQEALLGFVKRRQHLLGSDANVATSPKGNRIVLDDEDDDLDQHSLRPKESVEVIKKP